MYSTVCSWGENIGPGGQIPIACAPLIPLGGTVQYRTVQWSMPTCGTVVVGPGAVL
jgi:hypothetical protein